MSAFVRIPTPIKEGTISNLFRETIESPGHISVKNPLSSINRTIPSINKEEEHTHKIKNRDTTSKNLVNSFRKKTEPEIEEESTDKEETTKEKVQEEESVESLHLYKCEECQDHNINMGETNRCSSCHHFKTCHRNSNGRGHKCPSGNCPKRLKKANGPTNTLSGDQSKK